jgi:CHASE3 domain sensor protein
MEGLLHNSSTARKLFQAVKERLDEGKTREALASLDELERLCQKEPTAMFVVAGGQATIDWFRAEMQKQLKDEEDRERAVREEAELHQQSNDAKDRERASREAREQLAAREQRFMLEVLRTVILGVGSLLLVSVMDWIWPT